METHCTLLRLIFASILALLVGVTAASQVSAAEPHPSRVLIVSREARESVDPAKLRQIAKEEGATLVLAAKLPAYTRYVNCDSSGAAATLGLLSWACDTEYFCANTMTLTVKVGTSTVTCSYEDCRLVGDQCDCDLKAGQDKACPK